MRSKAENGPPAAGLAGLARRSGATSLMLLARAKRAAAIGLVSRSPVARSLDLDLAGGDAARSDDDLPRNADQVGRGELAAGALVGVIVEHVEPGRLSAA
jgi:hypothetical protein